MEGEKFKPIRDFTGQSIISSQQFDLETLNIFHESAKDIDKMLQNDAGRIHLRHFLSGKIIAVLFYQSSTRTRSSFEMSLMRLGAGNFTETDISFSSRLKGEALGHTVRVLTGKKGGADLVVVRDPQKGFFEAVLPYAKLTNTPIINGGDGAGEHPFQALKDDYTFREHFGTPAGRRFTFVGDIKESRVIHSTASLLSLYKDVEMNFVAPAFLKAQPDLLDMLKKRKVKFKEFDSLREMEEQKEEVGDGIYMVRLQAELYQKQNPGLAANLRQIYKNYVITPQWVEKHPSVNIYHPMPIERMVEDKPGEWKKVDGEIYEAVDFMPQNKYFGQSDNGIVVAGALMWLILRYHQK